MKKWRNDVFNLINNYIYSKWFTSVDQCLSIWPAGGAAGLQIAQTVASQADKSTIRSQTQKSEHMKTIKEQF